MILRVWALYNQSHFILGALLTFYAVGVIIYISCVVISIDNQLQGM